MNPIKLVIWDLDRTFWDGTLSEEGITLRPENHELVHQLLRRGIMNSICSKNDPDQVNAVLEREDLRDQFVFSKIAWLPKGEMVAQTIQEMNLRAVNVLLIDDNPQNLEEAKFFNAGLQVAAPDVLSQLLAWPQTKGRDDASLSRWRQYRQLEQKVTDQNQFHDGSNEDFLRQCDIRVTIAHDCAAQFDRLLEMIDRTNQLNFTKRRVEIDSFRADLSDPSLECAYLSVADRYGDYGISGFYALRDGRLEHFLFSCRIMNMGIETWLYNHLQRPLLEVVGETVADPTRLPPPDWITLETELPARPARWAAATAKSTADWPRTIFKGGCDLEQMIDFLGRPGRIDREFNYKSTLGAPIHRDHTEILRRCRPETMERFGATIDRIPFLDRQVFATQIFDDRYEVVVYSTLMDMSLGQYRLRGTDLVVDYGTFSKDMTLAENWPRLLAGKPWLTEDFLSWFSQEFEFLGPLSVDDFRANLRWLCRQVASPKQLILLNGSQIELEHDSEHERWRHHVEMNAVIDEVAAEHSHVDVCDVRLTVSRRGQIVDNIRHYRRGAHFQLARQIEQLVANRHSLPTSHLSTWFNAGKAFVRDVLWKANRGLFGAGKPLRENQG